MFNIGKNDFVINTTSKDSNIQALVSDITKENSISQKELKFILYKKDTAWGICLLCAIIVIIVACFIVLYMNEINVQQQILEVLAVVSTLLAITLSAFSIFYSYYSTKESSAILVKVSHEVERIEATYKSLELHQGQLLNILARNGKSNATDNVDNKSADINQDTNNLPTNIQQPNVEDTQPQTTPVVAQPAPQKEEKPTVTQPNSEETHAASTSKRIRKPASPAIPQGNPDIKQQLLDQKD